LLYDSLAKWGANEDGGNYERDPPPNATALLGAPRGEYLISDHPKINHQKLPYEERSEEVEPTPATIGCLFRGQINKQQNEVDPKLHEPEDHVADIPRPASKVSSATRTSLGGVVLLG
jgi:hypothetical protein